MSVYLEVQVALRYAFMLVYHQDHIYAAMQCAKVRYSPLTVMVAELIHREAYDEEYFTGDLANNVNQVLAVHKEDTR